MAIRLFVSAILGGVIGYERETKNHPAGLRTHMLVSVGSTLIMLISIGGFSQYSPNGDPARLAAQVVSGIGFVGAGTIFKQGSTVRGLTTAASLWMCAGIGLAVGVGFYFAAVFAAIISISSLTFLNQIESKIPSWNRQGNKVLFLYIDDTESIIGDAEKILKEYGLEIRKFNISVADPERNRNSRYTETVYTKVIRLVVHIKDDLNEQEITRRLMAVKGIKALYWKDFRFSSKDMGEEIDNNDFI